MIVKTPRGEAPEGIRQAWIGVIIPCLGKFPPELAAGVLTGELVDREGQNTYKVWQEGACSALAQKNPDAAQWWKSIGYPRPGKKFVFYEDEVMVLPEGNDKVSWG